LCRDCAPAERAKGWRECSFGIPQTIYQAKLVHPIQVFAVPSGSPAPGIEGFTQIEIASDDPRIAGLWLVERERRLEQVADPDVSVLRETNRGHVNAHKPPFVHCPRRTVNADNPESWPVIRLEFDANEVASKAL